MKCVNKITKNNFDTGSYNCRTRKINLPNADSFILSHELGHAIDHSSNCYIDRIITEDSTVEKTYKEELKQYKKHFSQPQRSSVAYFILDDTFDGKGLGEIVAETNAMLNALGSPHFPAIEERTHFLQQYFPKTIAKIATKLDTIKLEDRYIY